MTARTGSAARTLRVGLVQMRCAPNDPAANLARAIAGIEDAAARGAELVCLQELFRTPYFCQSEEQARFDLAEPVPGPTTEALAKVAAARGVVIVSSVFERRAEGLYHNTAVVLDADGRHAGVYRKMHIPDDPLYYEKFYFTPGDLGFQRVRDARRTRRHAGVLGPVVPGSGAPDRARRRADARSTRRRSAGRPACAPSGKPPSTTPGRPRSARTRSRTASSSSR